MYHIQNFPNYISKYMPLPINFALECNCSWVVWDFMFWHQFNLYIYSLLYQICCLLMSYCQLCSCTVPPLNKSHQRYICTVLLIWWFRLHMGITCAQQQQQLNCSTGNVLCPLPLLHSYLMSHQLDSISSPMQPALGMGTGKNPPSSG